MWSSNWHTEHVAKRRGLLIFIAKRVHDMPMSVVMEPKPDQQQRHHDAKELARPFESVQHTEPGATQHVPRVEHLPPWLNRAFVTKYWQYLRGIEY
jgi:hypothetical protein